MRGEKGSSRWLVLAAVVFRQAEDVETVRVMRGALARSFTKPPASAFDSPQLALAQTPCHG